MTYTIELPSSATLRPNAEAAKRIVAALRELGASEDVIQLAEETAKRAEEAEEASKLNVEGHHATVGR